MHHQYSTPVGKGDSTPSVWYSDRCCPSFCASAGQKAPGGRFAPSVHSGAAGYSCVCGVGRVNAVLRRGGSSQHRMGGQALCLLWLSVCLVYSRALRDGSDGEWKADAAAVRVVFGRSRCGGGAHSINGELGTEGEVLVLLLIDGLTLQLILLCPCNASALAFPSP